MKAVILAGGEGTRLRPLTDTIPKPLVPVGGRPVLFYLLDALRRAGVGEAAVTLRYRGDQIRRVCGDRCCGVSLRYYDEEKPLGTAGAVRVCADFLGDAPFLVLSGDVLTDCPFQELIGYHRRHDADATLLLAQAADPREYGVVLCNTEGRVTRFLEKPAWAQALTDAVNAGIYVLGPSALHAIPEGKAYDFSRDLFPRLLAEGKQLYGFSGNYYWCDVGDPAAYLAANLRRSGNETVYGDGCRIAEDAFVERSVLWQGVTVGAGAVIRGAILCDGVFVGPGARIAEECMVCEGAEVPAGAVLPRGTVFRRGAAVPGEILRRHRLIDGGVRGEHADVFSCMRLGVALAAAGGSGCRIGVLCGAGAADRLAREALLCGIAAAGGRGYDFGEGFEAMAAFAAIRLGMDLSVCLRFQKDGALDATLFDGCGLYPERCFERALEAALGRSARDESLMLPLSSGTVSVCDRESCEELASLYRATMAREALNAAGGRAELTGIAVSVRGGGMAGELLEDVLRERGADVSPASGTDRLELTLDPRGDALHVREVYGGTVCETDFWHVAAILIRAEAQRGLRVLALPFTAPGELARFAAAQRLTVLRYTGCPADASEALVRTRASEQLWLRDASFAAVRLCACMADTGSSLRELLASLPPFFGEVRSVPASGQYKTLVMRKLGVPDREGIRLDYGKKASVRIIPGSDDRFRLIAEADSPEVAREIMALSEKQLRSLF